MTVVITFPLHQVFQTVVAHVDVQYLLDLILFLAVDESWGWGWCRSLAKDGIRRHEGQFDHREDGVKAAEVGGAKRGGMRHGRHRLRQQRGPSISVTA
jgi:hypothetical protein